MNTKFIEFVKERIQVEKDLNPNYKKAQYEVETRRSYIN